MLGELAVWRAGLEVSDTDHRPAGPDRYTDLECMHQQRLQQCVIDAYGDPAAPRNRWADIVNSLDTRVSSDALWPEVADKIDLTARSGLDITTLLTDAAAQRPLPDEMPAAALCGRPCRNTSTPWFANTVSVVKRTSRSEAPRGQRTVTPTN
ncbi:hypothetical protein ACFWBG_24860 [Nocardia salmonicida]|uniref:hypothetical protein n=1 Tax=Nocardia salmonicida TaxID=53431 RepID=UPI003671538A